MKKTSIFLGLMAAFTFAQTPNLASAAEETAIFAGGCFWCVESDFQDVDGVIDAVSGLTGGTSQDPTYRSYGDHREAVMITFDNSKISYDDLVNAFFRSIDPTDAGGQFCDRGKTYTTAVYATSPKQAQIAEATKAKFEQSGVLPAPIVTDVLDASTFYLVDQYHQDYYQSNEIVITRFGPLTKAKAYKRYRDACGRDARVFELWGENAFKKAGL